MNQTVTAEGALKRLRETAEDEPIPSPEDLGQGDLTSTIIQLQNRVAGLTYCNEALIDILKAFDIITIDVFDIAYQNVLEYDNSPIDSRKLFGIRARALKKKLADYARSKDAPAEGSLAIPAKSAKRKVKAHG
jgi:hypothetical protein